MQGSQKDDTRPLRPVRVEGPNQPKIDRRILYMLLIGILAGSLLTILVGYGLVLSGSLSFGGETCPPANPICPATPAYLPVCPTCGVLVVTATPTFTPTTTLDAAATATAACTTFESQFPGTPCPSQP